VEELEPADEDELLAELEVPEELEDSDEEELEEEELLSNCSTFSISTLD